MLSREEVKELAEISGEDSYFVSFYLNVDPMFNVRGDYGVHCKNMIKDLSEKIDKGILKRIKDDLQKIENYVTSNRRILRKGLAILSSTERGFWRDYNFNVPFKNDIVVDKTPYVKPLLDILDNYQRYALLLVDKESARIFLVHLGDIVEYGEVYTPGIPGKHKKGGWFALSQNHYERHIEHHVAMHLKDVLEKFESFLKGEYIGRVILGGSDEAVSMIKGMLHKGILDKVIGTARIEMFAKPDEVLRKVEPVVSEFEKKKEEETIDELIERALKNNNAVLGIDDVLNALQEQRVMKLIFVRDYKVSGYNCPSCGYLSTQNIGNCLFCNARLEKTDQLVDLAGQKAIGQNALVEVVTESKKLMDAGGIGAFLRF
jgi:peptide chain release factor subunit 1